MRIGPTSGTEARVHGRPPATAPRLLGPVPARRRPRLPRPARPGLVLPVLVGLLLSSAYVFQSTQAAFTATTSTSASVGTGFVSLTDDDSGSALISVTGLVPGVPQTRCVTVAYGGSLPARVRLHAALAGTGLAPHLDLRLRRGTFATPPGSGSCAGFVADTADHVGGGAGVLYDGPLGAFPTAWADGLVDPSDDDSPAAQSWQAGDSHGYEVRLTLEDDDAAQGLSVNGTLTWEARSMAGTGTRYVAEVLADQPVAYWRFEETSGTVAADETGAHPGVYDGGVTLGVRGAPIGELGHGASFDGVDDGVEVPWAAALNPATFTVEAWARSDAGVVPYQAVVASYEHPPQSGFGLWADGAAEWNSYLGNGNNGYATATATRAAGVWTHLVATYDGTTLRIHADGQLVHSTTGVLSQNTSAPLGIGGVKYAAGGGWSELFQGSVDEVAVYATVLSPERILAHYQAGQ